MTARDDNAPGVISDNTLVTQMESLSGKTKSNVLGRIIVPRLNETTHYINSELEEMEREEVFRLKRVKQKKELQKQIDMEKWLKSIAEKNAAATPDSKGTSTPKKPEGKSPGGSKTGVNRPPETINLLILNPRDDPDPTSTASTFISPFGGKTIPGITQVEELFDHKDQSRLDSILNSTDGESKVDRVQDVGDSKEKAAEVQKLNEPARGLVQEVTRDEFQHIKSNNYKGIEDMSRFTDNITSNAVSSKSARETTLTLASNDTQGYVPDVENSKRDVKRVKESTDVINAALNTAYKNNIMEQDTLRDVSQIIVSATKSGSVKSVDITEDMRDKSTYDVKDVKGTTNPVPDLTASNTKVWINDTNDASHGEYSAAQVNAEKVEPSKEEVNNIPRGEKLGEQQYLTPAKILVSEVTKELISTYHDKIHVKDAETMHEVSMHSTSTQYDNIEEQKIVGTHEPKFYTNTSTNTGKETKDESKDDWDFVLPSDQQSDDVDSKPVIQNDIKDDAIKVTESAKNKITESITSNKPLRIRDSDTSIHSSDKMDDNDDDEGDYDEDDETTPSKRKKRRKKRKGIHHPDNDNETTAESNEPDKIDK